MSCTITDKLTTIRIITKMADNCVDGATVVAMCGLAVSTVLIMRRRRNRRNRKICAREWILGWERQGAYHQLKHELHAMDVSSYCNFLRMHSSTFERLLTMVAPLITRRDTNMCQAITPSERLALTLGFLATGNYCI